MKLALVRSSDLFELLEAHGAALIESRFGPNDTTPQGVSGRIIDLSIQIMLEELGPNLWEFKLDRCVDYGESISKMLYFFSSKSCAYYFWGSRATPS